MSNLIRKSPNEIERESRLRAQNERISRLKDLRIRQCKWEAERRHFYKEITKQGWDELLQKMLRDWLETKMDQIDQLQNLKSMLLQEIGKAHKSAVTKRELDQKDLDKVVQEMIFCQKKAQERGLAAGKQVEEEQRVRLEPEWVKRALLKSVKQVEDLRAKYVVEKQRLKPPVSDSNLPPHLPISKIRPLNRDYQSTHHHRNYGTTSSSTAQTESISDVFQNAKLESKKREQGFEQKQVKKQENAIIAAERYQKAINTVLIEKVLIKLMCRSRICC